MADMQGSESKYAGSATQGGKAQGAKAPAAAFGSSIVTPPISGPMQNIVPGSQEWVNARMATIIAQLKQQYGDAAARRGMLQSGASEEELAKAIALQEQQVQKEAGDYNASIANREDTQGHEATMANKANRSQEKAAMFSGLGSMAPSLLFGKWGKDDSTLAGKGWEGLKGTLGMGNSSPSGNMAPDAAMPAQSPIMDSIKAPASPVAGVSMPNLGNAAPGSPVSSSGAGVGTWDRLKAGALGTGVGTMLGSNKNKLTGLLAGSAATGLAGMGGMSQGATAGLSGLASGMAGSIKGNMLSGKNWWKTLLAGGAGLAAGGVFGKF